MPDTAEPAPIKRRKDFVDITGQKFGNWTVLTKLEKKQRWLCRCVCGTERDIFGPDLKRGETKSCGCIPHVISPEQIAKGVATKAERLAKRKEREAKREAKRAAKLAAIEAAKPPPPPPPQPKGVIKYGRDWGTGPQINPLSIELACYRDRLKTGLPREQHLKNAFKLIWPDYQWNEWCEMLTWAWCNYRFTTVIGHTRASKTYHAAHLVLLHYLAADMMTSITLTTTKFDALKTRLWGDMLRAIDSMTPVIRNIFLNRYKITNSSNEMKLSVKGDDETVGGGKFIIQGIATDRGDTSAGKIRGLNVDRRVIVGDEASDIPDSIFVALKHADGSPDFIGLLLTNPVEKDSELGKHCCPKDGWGSISDTDLFWETKSGICLHFDGLQSPNIKAGKTIFPFLITQEYIDKIRKDEGEGSLLWWMFVRGFFPPDGLVAKVWTSGDIEKAKQDVEFDYNPTPCATLDPAFESDDCVIHFGLMGKLRDGKPCCKATESKTLQLKVGPNEIPKDYQVARQVMALCKERGIKPEDFIMDETGNARGVLAILRMEWSTQVRGICYGGEATDRPLRMDDAMKASERVKYFVSELWFRAAYMARDGMLCGLNSLDSKTVEDLVSRRYEMKNGLMIVFSKDLVKKALGRSPDHGDAFCQFGELMVRKGLVTSVMTNPQSKQWTTAKKLAIKASNRYAENRAYAHA